LDRVREALFNIVAPRLVGAAVLDLYAGTGALAIEALSRGARLALVVEPDGRARSALYRNLTGLDLMERADVWPGTAERAIRRMPSGRFDLVFLDPPWVEGVGDRVQRELPRVLAPAGLVVHERGAQGALAGEGLTLVDRRRYGRTVLDFWQAGRGH
jgi:16S rRNA (guanine966-N2)-methyltransferase